jgi:hypothetical protein
MCGLLEVIAERDISADVRNELPDGFAQIRAVENITTGFAWMHAVPIMVYARVATLQVLEDSLGAIHPNPLTQEIFVSVFGNVFQWPTSRVSYVKLRNLIHRQAATNHIVLVRSYDHVPKDIVTAPHEMGVLLVAEVDGIVIQLASFLHGDPHIFADSHAFGICFVNPAESEIFQKDFLGEGTVFSCFNHHRESKSNFVGRNRTVSHSLNGNVFKMEIPGADIYLPQPGVDQRLKPLSSGIKSSCPVSVRNAASGKTMSAGSPNRFDEIITKQKALPT